ncbi:pantoate--beta-alanine ligase [Pelagibacterales bacterium SAG-MED23]|nr:pantoate--beta-alanine ligase [Pelagibacterales bacterium SAG-MED23]
MKIITSIFDLNKEIKDYNNIGFVPTMGGIHDGHKSLIKASQKKKTKTIVSIFVNPTQFNKKDDFKNYPRNIKKDIAVLKKLNVEYLFTPKTKDIYKLKGKKFNLKKKDKILCAKVRNGHFEGVLNIMNRLMTIIKSKDLYMGEKDYQQLFLIKKYLSKKFNVRINSCPTIRIKNNIALSTRNNLLKKKSLKNASQIALFLKKIKYESKLDDPKLSFKLTNYKNKLEKKYNIKIDYLEFRDEKNLKLNNFKNKCRLFVAYNIDDVRLIDNY